MIAIPPIHSGQVPVLLLSQPTDFSVQLREQFEQEKIPLRQLECLDQIQAALQTNPPQLIILDCAGTAVAGLALCQEIRFGYAGLLVAIASAEDEQTLLLALRLGADLALSQRDGVPLIAAQVKALLRRFTPVAPPKLLTFGGITVDASRRDVFFAGEPAQLSTLEFNLFWTLAINAGCVVSRETIHHELYCSSYNGYDRRVDLSVSRIRQKIGDDPVMPRYLKTVRGVGYQFVGAPG